MFTPAHCALGALTERGLQGTPGAKISIAVLGICLHAITDNTLLWHAPYPWPAGTPALLRILSYPHDAPSWLWTIGSLVLTGLTIYLLRQYWWGMLWASAPDLVDWVILRPLMGQGWIHAHVWPYLYRMWSSPLEMLVIVVVLLALGRRRLAG